MLTPRHHRTTTERLSLNQPARHVLCFVRNCTISGYFSSSNNSKKTSPGSGSPVCWWHSLGSSLSRAGVAVGGDLLWQLTAASVALSGAFGCLPVRCCFRSSANESFLGLIHTSPEQRKAVRGKRSLCFERQEGWSGG